MTKTVRYDCKLCRMKNKGFGDLDGFLIAEIIMAKNPLSLRAAEKAIFDIYHVRVSYEAIRVHLPHIMEGKKDKDAVDPMKVLEACHGKKDTDFGSFDKTIHESLTRDHTESETIEERIEKFKDTWNKEDNEVDLSWRAKKRKKQYSPDMPEFWEEES